VTTWTYLHYLLNGLKLGLNSTVTMVDGGNEHGGTVADWLL
jgi:hypothetical protein